MEKLKEYILFTIIFLVGFILANKALDLIQGTEKSWDEIILNSVFIVLILLIAKILGFLDKKK